MSTATKAKSPPQAEPAPKFALSGVSVMTFVEVTMTPNWSEFAGGFVLRVNDRLADILMLRGGHPGCMTLLRDCVHADDPWCSERPAMFEDGDRGIFRLATNEKRMRLIIDQFQQMNDTLEQLVARVARFEQKEQKAGNDEQKPSRPNRQAGK